MNNSVKCWNTLKPITPQRGAEARARRTKKGSDSLVGTMGNQQAIHQNGGSFNDYPVAGSRAQASSKRRGPVMGRDIVSTLVKAKEVQ